MNRLLKKIITGALLSQFIEPVYLASVSFGNLYHRQHTSRSLVDRLNKCGLDFSCQPGFKINRPMMSPCTILNLRQASAKKAVSMKLIPFFKERKFNKSANLT